MDTLVVLTQLTLLLLLGIIFSIFSVRLKIPNLLFLLLIGIFFGNLIVGGKPLISFPPIFITSIGIIALVLIVFQSSSNFKWRDIDTLSLIAAKVAVVFLLMTFLFLTLFTSIIFKMNNIFFAMIFATLMSATSADAVLSLFNRKGNKAVDVLEVESIINTPLTVILPFILLGILQSVNIKEVAAQEFFLQMLALLQQFVTGIGAGVVVGLIIFKVMSKYYSEKLSPLILITAALLTYILAENLKGNGVLAVTVLGLFFGNFYFKEKATLNTFSEMFGNALMILVFVLLGLTIKLPLDDGTFFIKSLILFIIYIGIRIISIFISTNKRGFTLKEQIFMSLNMPKGIAVGVITLSLSVYLLSYSDFELPLASIPDGAIILNLTLIFMLYSIILSTVVTHFSKYFIKVEVAEK